MSFYRSRGSKGLDEVLLLPARANRFARFPGVSAEVHVRVIANGRQQFDSSGIASLTHSPDSGELCYPRRLSEGDDFDELCSILLEILRERIGFLLTLLNLSLPGLYRGCSARSTCFLPPKHVPLSLSLQLGSIMEALWALEGAEDRFHHIYSVTPRALCHICTP